VTNPHPTARAPLQLANPRSETAWCARSGSCDTDLWRRLIAADVARPVDGGSRSCGVRDWKCRQQTELRERPKSGDTTNFFTKSSTATAGIYLLSTAGYLTNAAMLSRLACDGSSDLPKLTVLLDPRLLIGVDSTDAFARPVRRGTSIDAQRSWRSLSHPADDYTTCRLYRFATPTIAKL